MHIAVSLVALGLGYLVYVGACKEKEGLKLLGQAIGIFVMIAALVTVACGAAKCAYMKGKAYGGGCPMAAKSMCSVDRGMPGDAK